MDNSTSKKAWNHRHLNNESSLQLSEFDKWLL